MLNKDPSKRLGAKKGLEEIKEHPFFNGVDFNAILKKEVPAPFIPTVKGLKDVHNFDEEFTNEIPEQSYIPDKNLNIIKANQGKFKEFK